MDSDLMAFKKVLKIGYILLSLTLPFSVSIPFRTHLIEVPTEPIMLILIPCLIYLWWKEGYPKQILKHPITWLSATWIGWMFIGIIPAFDPITTFKFAIVELAQWIVFYAGLGYLHTLKLLTKPNWFEWYALSFLAIMLYALYNLNSYNFRMDTTVLMARPFYFDHALLGACMALLLGIIGGHNRTPINRTFLGWRGFRIGMLVVLFIGILFCYSRAVWLSVLLGMLFCGGLIVLKSKAYRAWIIFLTFVLFVGMILSISISKSDPNAHKPKWMMHLSSAINMENNVSNLERVNRYRCAIRMAKDRPILGFGSGNFPEAFLPYQKADEMTRISVTTPGPHPPGRGGSVHSEYLRALAENGLVGGLLWCGLVLLSLYQVTNNYLFSKNKVTSLMALGLCFGLVTFYTHGFFNNFLHQGKLAILFWGCLSLLVSLGREDLVHSRELNT